MSTTEVAPDAITEYMYLGVRHKNVPDAKGIIVSASGEQAVVMRTHEHLGLATQDWGEDWEVDESAPTYSTDYGEMKLGQRVIFTAPYAGMRGTVVGHKDGNTFFLVDAGQEGFDTKPEWSDPDNTDTDTMFSPSSCEWHKIGHAVGTDKDGNPLKVGERVVYNGTNTDDTSEWDGVVGTVLHKGSAGSLVALVLDAVKQDGTPVAGDPYNYVGPTSEKCQLQGARMTPLKETPKVEKPKVETGYKSKDGEPICVGDVLEYVPGSLDWAGVIVKARDPNMSHKRYEFVKLNSFVEGAGYQIGALVNLTSSDLRHVPSEPEDPDVLDGFKYADGVPVKKGDRVVINPGHPGAGTVGTIVGPNSPYVLIEYDSTGEQLNWSPGNISRLQDEDKEKVADDVTQPTPALEKLQEILDQFGQAKDSVESAISGIESELDNVESGYIEVTVDAETVNENMSYDVTVQTSNDALLGMITYDGGGGLEIDDGEVDSHAQENATVEFSGSFETEASIGDRLSDLHSAFDTGRQEVEQLLSIVDEVTEVVTQMLADPVVVAKAAPVIIPAKEAETFTGVIRNARVGVTLPEDAETGPTLRFDVVGSHIEAGAGDSSGTKATRRVRLTGAQIGKFLVTASVSDVKNLEGRSAILTEDSFGGWYPTAISEVPDLDALSYEDDEEVDDE